MSRLPTLADADIPIEAEPIVEMAEAMMGFTANDVRDMARKPNILKGVGAMCGAIYGPGEISPGLKRLIGHVASTAAECRYCMIHTAHGAHENGEETARIHEAWSYESSTLFTEAERAALRVAQAGALSPSEVTDEMIADLRRYYSDAEIIEIVAVISMFGFLNRWNSILGTDLEEKPLSVAVKIGLHA